MVASAISTSRFIPTGAKWFSVLPESDRPWSGHESTHTAGDWEAAATFVDVGTKRLPCTSRRPGSATLLVSRRYCDPDGRLTTLSKRVSVSEPAVAHCPSWMPASSREFSTVTYSAPPEHVGSATSQPLGDVDIEPVNVAWLIVTVPAPKIAAMLSLVMWTGAAAVPRSRNDPCFSTSSTTWPKVAAPSVVPASNVSEPSTTNWPPEDRSSATPAGSDTVTSSPAGSESAMPTASVPEPGANVLVLGPASPIPTGDWVQIARARLVVPS